jgi:metal-responsive CopG/Arc/MetJ family transcriptional regulator
MRTRIPMILPEDLLIRVDALAGDKHRRSIIIETAIRNYVTSEEKKALKNGGDEVKAKTPGKKTTAAAK